MPCLQDIIKKRNNDWLEFIVRNWPAVYWIQGIVGLCFKHGSAEMLYQYNAFNKNNYSK